MNAIIHYRGKPEGQAELPCLPPVGTYLDDAGLYVVSALVLQGG